MNIVNETKDGVRYLIAELKSKTRVVTRAILWRIPHNSGREDVRMKIGRYKKVAGGFVEVLESKEPKSELTLDNEEFINLIAFLEENYEPFKLGKRKFISVEGDIDNEALEEVFNSPDKTKLLKVIVENDILPDELLIGVNTAKRTKAVRDFGKMLKDDLTEHEWQSWFIKNNWVLGSDFVRILDEREIDTENIADYLVEAYDGFLDIIEIKRPEGGLKFWLDKKDHDNYIPSPALTKAIIQATKYIYEVEREANSIKFLKRVDNIKTIKPRCVLIFGRSKDWNSEQMEAFRILNASYHNLTIMTYDHVLDRAKRILNPSN